jgi:acyl-CoA synthetase (NDP forming)
MTGTSTSPATSAGSRLRGVAALLDARSLAVVGATNRPGTPGSRVMQFLRQSGFDGEVLAVNPRMPDLGDVVCAPSVEALRPGPIDHVLVLTAAETVADILVECTRREVGVVSLFSAGYAEIGERGHELEDRFREIVGDCGLRILGPNCLGSLNAHSGLIASPASAFVSGEIRPGPISVVSQSGAVGAYLVGLLGEAGLGVRYFASTGNEIDLKIGEIVLHCARDEQTRVVIVYLEGLRDPDAFVEALTVARERGVTVVVLKSGGTELGAAAVRSHTAALAGDDAVYDAVFARLGAYRAESVGEAIWAARAAVSPLRPARRIRRLAVLTTSGGLGVMATDALARRGFELPSVPDETQERMRELLPFCAPGNPIDLGGQVSSQPEEFGHFLELTAQSMELDAMVVVVSNGPRSAHAFTPIRAALLDFVASSDVPVAVVGALTAADIEEFEGLGMIAVNDPAEAARRLVVLDGIVGAAQTQGALQLSEVGRDGPVTPLGDIDAMQVLERVGVRFAPYQVCSQDHPEVADASLFPAAVKLLQSGVLHKAAAGNVVLGVGSAQELATTAAAFGGRPGDLLVQRMVDGARDELIVSARRDPLFGPVVVIGTGGRHVEAMQDRILLLHPFDETTVHAALPQLRFFDATACPEDALRELASIALAAAAVLDADLAVAELEINPVIVRRDKPWTVAVDAVVQVYGEASDGSEQQ